MGTLSPAEGQLPKGLQVSRTAKWKQAPLQLVLREPQHIPKEQPGFSLMR